MKLDNITPSLAANLIASQFPEYANFSIRSVDKQGHDNRTFCLGDELLIRIPTTEIYALKIAMEQELLPKLASYLSIEIPAPINMGIPSIEYPYQFSIYKWIDGRSANTLQIDDIFLKPIALQLALFLKELQSIDKVDGPAAGQHNWWRGDHISI